MKLISWSVNVVSGWELLSEFVRRKLWKLLFAPHQKLLGPFFLDAQDHIGAERIITGKSYEERTLTVLATVVKRLKLGDGIALDVGANIGNHSCWFAKHFQAVHSFEPGTVAALLLRANVISSGRHNIVVHQCALGSRKYGGVLNQISATNLGSSTVTESLETADFMIYRGDDYWNDLNIDDRVELIKIDVEGFESEVVSGFSSLLRQQLPLLCVEVLKEQKWQDLKKSLLEIGYSSWWVVTHSGGGSGLVKKCWELIRGRQYCLSPLPTMFPASGFDMIICTSAFHEKKLHDD